ncbi:MAG: ABC transporter, partial [Beijerinckiaceae bacterium]
EPFAAVDQDTMTDLMQLICNWRDEGRTVVAVLHDLDIVRRRFPRTLLLAGEPIAWGPTTETMRQEHLLRARETSDGAQVAANARHFAA